MLGHRRLVDFPLSSVPDLPKRSVWAFEALNSLLLNPGVCLHFSVTALETHFTIISSSVDKSMKEMT